MKRRQEERLMVRESDIPTSPRERSYVVMGIFQSRTAMENGIADLRVNGFVNGDISALIPQPESVHDFGHTAGTKAPEGVSAGVAVGAVAGGMLGWLVGAGTLAIPGFGALIAAGPIVAALAGLGGGSAIGGIAGGLIGFGFPEYEAKRYEGQVKGGGLLISVHCIDSDWRDKAKGILERAGATDIASTHESRSPDEIENIDIEPARRAPPSASI
jgi:hypothetical protein